MRLEPPIGNFDLSKNVSQYFGVNHDYYWSNFGLEGHNGIDIVAPDDPKLGYGVIVKAAHDWDSIRYEEDFPIKKRGNGVWLRKKLDKSFMVRGREAHFVETVYWHLADFDVRSSGKAGEPIGKMGNTGHVYPKPTNDCNICPFYGTHLHFAVSFYDLYGRLIPSEYNNGYSDPVPYLYRSGNKFSKMNFTHDLYWRSQGDEVAWLQTLLKISFDDLTFEPIGYYGGQTVKAVARLQERHGLTPKIGYFGAKTKSLIRSLYLA